MAWFKPRYRICMVEPRLSGLVVIERKSDDDPPVGTMYSWFNVERGSTLWRVLDDGGQRVMHGGRYILLSLRNELLRSLASRCQKRAFRRALSNGTLALADDCHASWFDRLLLLVVGIVLAIWWVPPVLTILRKVVRGEELWVTGEWLVLLYAITAFVSLLCFVIVGLCLKWGISALVRPNVRWVRFNSMGIQADMTDGRQARAAWCDLVSIKRAFIVMGLRFRTAGDFWLAGLGERSVRLLWIVEERFVRKAPKPDPFAPRRLLIRGFIIALAGTVLGVWLLGRFVPHQPVPSFLIAAFFLMILAPYLLLAFQPTIRRWGMRQWRRKRRLARMKRM